jgi:hypothetical protein
VGAWFTPILVAQADAWMAAGVPVSIAVTYGGPPQCDSPPAGLVVICLHPTDVFSPSTGSGLDCTQTRRPSGCVTSDATTRYAAVCSSAYSYSPVDCAATSETIWIKQVFPAQRLANIVRHEIGHVLGLGYNPDPASVMEIHGANSAILPSDVANVAALYANRPAQPREPPVSIPAPDIPTQAPSPACTAISLLCDLQH